ncbi:uncharacterized protein [Taeniopygia guttata]|uniref:uncharacterized protein n=1 Tax=Taeniopygia guttata TaxID=59729 RepID=UPI003BB8EB1F
MKWEKKKEEKEGAKKRTGNVEDPCLFSTLPELSPTPEPPDGIFRGDSGAVHTGCGVSGSAGGRISSRRRPASADSPLSARLLLRPPSWVRPLPLPRWVPVPSPPVRSHRLPAVQLEINKTDVEIYIAVSAVTPVLRKALWKELGAAIQDPEATVKLQILSKLLPPPGSKGLHKLMDCLPAAPERAGNEESWAVADAISTVLKNSEELHSWRRHLFSACIKGLVAMYSSSKDEGKQEVERSMLLKLEELLREEHELTATEA